MSIWYTVSRCVGVLSENVTVILVLSLVLVVTLYIITTAHSMGGKGRYPPGPWGFPIIGHLPLLGRDPLQTMARYRQQFGDVFSIRMGSFPTVVINGKDAIKEALTKNLDDFAGRPKLYSGELVKQKTGGVSGLTFTEFNPAWKVHRRITNNAIRRFANYKNNPVEEIINEEGNRLVDLFLQQNGEPFDPRHELLMAAGSANYQIMFGRSSSVRNDGNFIQIAQSNLDFSAFYTEGNPVDVMPWTRFILPGHVKRFLNIIERGMEVLNSQLKDHQRTYDPAELRDVMDALLQASDELTPEDKALGLNSEVITSATTDLIGAAFETVGTTLYWAILLMLTSPNVQDKVHAEIDAYLGKYKEPSYEDRKHLPYVEATVLEIQRFGSVLPFAAPHATTRDVEFKGYFIPRDTFVFINLDSLCSDKEIWGDPEVFRPERFLKEGAVDSAKAEMFFRFGAGRRRCLGEALAKVELFLLFTRLMQRCSFSKAEGEDYSLFGHFGFTTRPSPYRVIFKQRHS